MADSTYQTVMHRAVDLLARREHSFEELLQKLSKKGFDEEIALDVLLELKKRKLQSDDRFTEAFVNERTRRGHGPVKIQHELTRKGVHSNLIETYVDASEYHWIEQAQLQYNKKYNDSKVTDYKEWSKRARFLQGRGFTMQQIRASVNFDKDLD